MLIDITVEEALDILRNIAAPLQPESVALLDSLHRIAANELAALCDLPLCSQSAVDGFVVHNNDLQGERELKIKEGVLSPGEMPPSPLIAGYTFRVATGGTLPAGAAAIIAAEEAVLRGNNLFVKKDLAPGTNIRFQGEDFKIGETIFPRNTLLTPGMLGVLAALGKERIMVVPRPRVAIVCLAPEIVPHHIAPASRQVRDSNGPLLKSLVLQDGGDVVALAYRSGASTRKDFLNSLEELFQKADLVITTGGTAFGEPDHQAIPLLIEAGVTMLYWGIQAKPGSHSGCGFRESKPVLALSGYPSASAVGYHLLVSPVLHRMQGLPYDRKKTTAVCVDRFRKNGGIRRFLRGQMFIEEGMRKVKILPGQKSSMLRSLLSYNSLIDLQAGHPPLEKDAVVPVIPIPWAAFQG